MAKLLPSKTENLRFTSPFDQLIFQNSKMKELSYIPKFASRFYWANSKQFNLYAFL